MNQRLFWLPLSAVALLAVAGAGQAADTNIDPVMCGKACLAKADYKRAESDFKKAVQQSPKSCEGHFLLGHTYCKMKQYGDAKDQLRQAIRFGHGSENAQKANVELMQLPQDLLAPKTGVEAQKISSMLEIPSSEDGEKKPTVIDFYATWCSPCKQLDVGLEKAKSEFGDKVHFLKIDVDDVKNHKLIDQYEISPIPTVVFLNSQGEVVSFSIGYSGDANLTQSIKKILPAT